MKIAIMQPYLFPYIGYYQLINAVDRFVILDSVNYINKGWINRNQILLNGKPLMFTLPIKDASQNKLICDLSIVDDELWKKKFFKSLHYAYQKSLNFEKVITLIQEIFNYSERNLSNFLTNALLKVLSYLNIKTEIKSSRDIESTQDLKGSDRILKICKFEKASVYINPFGGHKLYDRKVFKDSGLNLYFLKPKDIKYRQSTTEFIANLSIIDMLMNVPQDEIPTILNGYELI